MPRLKDRNKQIPNGFKFLEPSTGWSAPAWSSFDTIVRSLISNRKGNAFNTAKLKLATDFISVSNEVDAYNAKICEAHGWTEFILSEATFPKSAPRPQRSLRPLAADGASPMKRASAGIKVMMDWLGSGLRPVEQSKAEARAAVCVLCPLNKSEEGLFATLTEKAMNQVKNLIEVKNAMDLRTALDEKLLACTACGCHNRLKVWTPIEHVLAGQTQETKEKLDHKCWVLAESK